MSAFGDSSATSALHAELVRKWIKDPLATPLAKDLARLAGKTTVSTPSTPPSRTTSGLDAAAHLLAELAAALVDDPAAEEETHESVLQAASEAFSGVSGGAEKDAVASFLTSSVEQGILDPRVVRILTTVNQGFVAPVSIELKLRLGMDYISSDVRDSWMVSISVDRQAQTVSVTHAKAEVGLSIPFALSWSLTVVTTWAADPVEDALLSSSLSIRELDVAGLDRVHMEHISGALKPFLAPHAATTTQLALASLPDTETPTLALIGASLDALPDVLFENGPPDPAEYLASLQLDMNNLSTLPPPLGTFAALTTLTATSNRLTEIPSCVFELSSLTTLHLGSNSISEVPDEIRALSSLTDLSLSYNSIRSLPLSLSTLPSLRKLYISNNNLAYIPTDLQFLSSLEVLHIHNNDGYPKELSGLDVPAIIDYLRARG